MKNIKHLSSIHFFSASVVLCLINFHPSYAQTNGNTVRDRDGNSYYIKRMPDDKLWMTTNLRINIPGSFTYDTAAPANHSYGRLYTWKAAQEGCVLVGPGWHLPTNDDWQYMASFYGGVRDSSADGGKAAYRALIDSGSSGFNAVYGGSWHTDGRYYHRVNAHGFYWTATETDSTNAWFYNLGRNGKIVNRHPDGEKHNAISVRCVKNN